MIVSVGEGGSTAGMRRSAQAIYHEAAKWVVKTDEGLTTEQKMALKAWLADDPRHLGAYFQVSSALARFDRVWKELRGGLDADRKAGRVPTETASVPEYVGDSKRSC